MTKKQAIEKGFTHVGFTYGIVKIYAKDIYSESPEVTGVSKLDNIILDVLTWIDVTFQLSDGFYMEVTDLI